MTSLDRALAEERHLRFVRVWQEIQRQEQLQAEGLTPSETAKRIGIGRVTVWRREKLIRRLSRKGINRGG